MLTLPCNCNLTRQGVQTLVEHSEAIMSTELRGSVFMAHDSWILTLLGSSKGRGTTCTGATFKPRSKAVVETVCVHF